MKNWGDEVWQLWLFLIHESLWFASLLTSQKGYFKMVFFYGIKSFIAIYHHGK